MAMPRSLSRRSILSALGLAACSSETIAPLHARRGGLATESIERTRSAHPPFTFTKLKATRRVLDPLHERLGAPKPGDWLSDHPETGQTFEEYLTSRPNVPTAERRTLVVQPLGELPNAHARIVKSVAEYLGRHFALPVRLAESRSLDVVPRDARRHHDGRDQLLTQHLLKEVMPSLRASDAAATLGLLATDLWPGRGWNYVFGEASLDQRVGVWSLARYGDPSKDEASYRLALLRALKIAVHETGHMFSLLHCTQYRCVQQGVNSLDEADRSPLWLCPDCLAKIMWVTRTDPKDHLEACLAFARSESFEAEATFFEKSLKALA
jgi:archaemetzincin